MDNLCAVDAVIGNLGHGAGERGNRAARHQHRHQRAGVPRVGPSPGLPGLLRSATGDELLLLRRLVLGVPGRRLVCELLVQRTVGPRGPCSRYRSFSCAFPCATTAILPGTFGHGGPDAPPRWGEHWGNRLGAASTRMGPVGPQVRTGTGAAARLPAAVLGSSVSLGGAGSPRCMLKTTTTSRTSPSRGSTVRIRRATHRLHLLGRVAQQAPVARSPGNTTRARQRRLSRNVGSSTSRRRSRIQGRPDPSSKCHIQSRTTLRKARERRTSPGKAKAKVTRRARNEVRSTRSRAPMRVSAPATRGSAFALTSIDVLLRASAGRRRLTFGSLCQ